MEKDLYAIVDIETTGGYAASHGITEIAIFIHDGEQVIESYNTLINPQQQIPLHITTLTGISNEMVQEAPLFEDVADEIYNLLHDKIFVAHSVNFDYSFVLHQLKYYGYDLRVKRLCTVRLSRKVFAGLPSYSLGNLCRSLHIPLKDRHRASGDAAATVLLFEKILQNNGIVHIGSMLKRSSAEQWIPTQLEKEKINLLPTGPGVYYLYDKKGKIIYVGKAINIKKRVSSHFTHNDAGSKRQRFLRYVADVRYALCASELHALVLESAEIRRLWPKYNSSQKQPVQKFALYCYEDNRGYMRLAIDKKKKNLPALYRFNLLHEGISMLRKMAETFELNEKLCFLDKEPLTKNDLAFLEEPIFYNGKVKTALASLDEKLPSFALLEEDKARNETLCMLIDRGNFWGMGYINLAKKNIKKSMLKEILEPYHDNDFIRNSIYSYISSHPEKMLNLKD
ncbi:MAG: GIY-YIG nuclease family protein [Niastella sp.]|nr:GIY-YIG nuclease family protein [Niastella sp.]